MVECRGEPGVRCMAGLTPMVQHSNDMIWINRLLIVRLMTGITVCEDELIVVVRVTFLALNGNMFPRQRKLRRCMVKRSRFPGIRGVTLRARLRIALSLVIWIGGTGIVSPMAIDAIHGQRGELVVDVTVFAENSFVRTGQRELR
jgi:hypothetical protein